MLIHVADPQRTQSDHWLTGVLWFVSALPRFAVPMFFLFSGLYLGLSPRNNHPIRFYRRTLKFLIVPYAVYSLMYSLPRVWEGGNWMRAVWNDLLNGTACYHLWFVPRMVQAYLYHPFLNRWYRTLKHPGQLVAACLALRMVSPALIPSLRQTFPPASSPLTWLMGSPISWFVPYPEIAFLILGYYVLDHSDEIRGNQWQVIVAPSLVVWILAALGIAVLNIMPAINHRALLAGLLWTLLPLAAFPVVLSIVEKSANCPSRCRNLLHSFGLYSYGIYLLHPALLYLLRRLLVYGFGIPLGNPLLYPLLFALTALSALQVVRVVARVPIGRYLA
jgi:surface polysaccharide O-acyltransferase-like enzyme